MSGQAFGFGNFVPGFDFLQNLAQGAAQNMPQMPNPASWVAPTLNVEELDKRISELKAVHFWLDQNGKALAATIQALEVQKMTLATLQGMNLSMGELAEAMKLKPADTATTGKPKDKGASAPAGIVDPLQWWGSLTQQFQQIAADAMKDVAQKAAAAPAKPAPGAAKSGAAPKKARTRRKAA
jgi:hypothetical protein